LSPLGCRLIMRANGRCARIYGPGPLAAKLVLVCLAGDGARPVVNFSSVGSVKLARSPEYLAATHPQRAVVTGGKPQVFI
jgi:hypothetical protein